MFEGLEAQMAALKAAANPVRGKTPGGINVGESTGISDYNGINLAAYNNPYDPNSKFSRIANSSKGTPWSHLALRQQEDLANQANQAAKGQAQGLAANAKDRLAMQGGLTSGARERAESDAGKNTVSMLQDSNKNLANNAATLGIQDAKDKINMLSMDNQQKAENVKGQNQYNMYTSGELNKAVAANKQAEATANSGGGLCLVICASSALMGSMNMNEARAAEKGSTYAPLVEKARSLRSEYSTEQLRGYYRASEFLVPKIEHSLVAKKIVFATIVKPALDGGLVAKIYKNIFGLFGRKTFKRSNGEVV